MANLAPGCAPFWVADLPFPVGLLLHYVVTQEAEVPPFYSLELPIMFQSQQKLGRRRMKGLELSLTQNILSIQQSTSEKNWKSVSPGILVFLPPPYKGRECVSETKTCLHPSPNLECSWLDCSEANLTPGSSKILTHFLISSKKKKTSLADPIDLNKLSFNSWTQQDMARWLSTCFIQWTTHSW